MKAALFVGKPLFELRDIESPSCPVSGLVVRIRANAICGTDLKIMKCQDVKIEKGKVTGMELPRITGHEMSGVVEKVGKNTKAFEVGDKVVVAPTIPCLDCEMCKRGYHEMCENVEVIGYHRDGGFAELVRVDADVLAAGCVVKIPENVSFEAASLTEPLSCAINCLELSPVKKDATVLVMGAGPLGLIIADLASYQGAKQVIVADISKEQLDKSGVSSATLTINLAQEDVEGRIDELTNGVGADLVVTACPAPEAQQVGLNVVAKKGAVNFFGGLPRDRAVVPLDTNLIHYKEITVIGTHGSAPRHVTLAVELQANGAMDLSKYVDRTFSLEQINEALDVSKGNGRLKVVITPT